MYATTATAPPQVLEDIRKNLGIDSERSFHLNLENDRPNIASEVRYIKLANDFKALQFLEKGVKTTEDLRRGIVFTNSIMHSQIACREF